ncbi:MAG: NUDIX domain-containing protein [Microgenomates group bacterium]
MQKIIPVVIAVIHHKGKYLLTEREGKDPDDIKFGRVWHFPGGALEFGEQLDSALIREIKEETNLDIKVECQLPHIFSAVRMGWHGVLIPYLCSVIGNNEIVLDHESIDYGWYTFKEICKLKKLTFVQEMADDAVSINVPREGVEPS